MEKNKMKNFFIVVFVLLVCNIAVAQEFRMDDFELPSQNPTYVDLQATFEKCMPNMHEYTVQLYRKKMTYRSRLQVLQMCDCEMLGKDFKAQNFVATFNPEDYVRKPLVSDLDLKIKMNSYRGASIATGVGAIISLLSMGVTVAVIESSATNNEYGEDVRAISYDAAFPFFIAEGTTALICTLLSVGFGSQVQILRSEINSNYAGMSFSKKF